MRFSKLLVALAVLALAACGGGVQGVVRGEATPVTLAYEQGFSSDTWTAQMDGETFTGRAVMTDARSTIGTGFGTFTGSGGTGFGSGTVFGTSTSGALAATLLGNRGSTMRCQFQYADPSGFTPSGGLGVCQHSDGRVIDVVW